MSVATERLILGRPYEHAASATTFSSSGATYNATDSARYSAGSVTIATFKNPPRFVSISNDDASIILWVTIGNNVVAPPTVTAGAERVYPGSTRFFELEDQFAVIQVKAASGSPTGSICWYA